ncbi:unnamed protein product, partial [Phaeothamnion confervicola]
HRPRRRHRPGVGREQPLARGAPSLGAFSATGWPVPDFCLLSGGQSGEQRTGGGGMPTCTAVAAKAFVTSDPSFLRLLPMTATGIIRISASCSVCLSLTGRCSRLFPGLGLSSCARFSFRLPAVTAVALSPLPPPTLHASLHRPARVFVLAESRHVGRATGAATGRAAHPRDSFLHRMLHLPLP